MGSSRSTDREVREKLLARGVRQLTDAELLSVLLGDGGEYGALETAERIMEAYGGSLLELARTDIRRLRCTEGIGVRRAAVLMAAFEMAERLSRQEGALPTVIHTQEDVVALIGPFVSRLPHEEMWAIYLSSANGVIEKMRVSQGGVTHLVVDCKLIVKRAIEVLASSLIVVHNHPSGLAVPSGEDIAVTERIAQAAALFDIRLIDHVIIADKSAYSFHEHGRL